MNQLNMFESTSEKGSSEWDLAVAVKSDRPGMFRVASPQKPETPRYTNVIQIRRFHAQQLYARGG